MNLITVNVESVRIGQPLPFALRSEDGRLLAHKGFVVQSRRDLQAMVGRGFNLYVDVTESESHHRAYVGKLHALVRQNKPLGQIAVAQLSTSDLDTPRVSADDGPIGWTCRYKPMPCCATTTRSIFWNAWRNSRPT